MLNVSISETQSTKSTMTITRILGIRETLTIVYGITNINRQLQWIDVLSAS